MSWWSRNAGSIEAGAATVTALVAVAALVGIKFQLDATDQLQQGQSARDAYRAHLSLASTLPQFARPEDACSLMSSKDGGSYEAFVGHLLYSAEQMLAIGEGWENTFLDELAVHTDYICSASSPHGATDETILLLSRFRADKCQVEPSCE
jgi:hypothetical protein